MALNEKTWASFADLFNNNPEAIKEILQLFIQESHTSSRRIVAAIDAGDTETVHRVAHNLKSTSHQLGGEDFSQTCRLLEAAGRAGDVETSRGLKAQFESQLRTLQQDLAERLGL